MAKQRLEVEVGANTRPFETKIKSLSSVAAKSMIALFSVNAVANFTKTAIAGYDKQIKAEQSLLVALKGRESIQRNLIQQATDLQRKTLFGDEDTIMAASRMAMVIGANEDAIKRLMPLVQDLASAKFEGNLATAADLVAKSVGSSTNALTRYGIEIKGAVGSTERLESAIAGLNRQVGGQAEAAAKIGLGPLQQLKNAWGDLTEEIGKAVLNSEWFKKSVSGLSKLVQNIQDRGVLSTLFEKRSTWEKWKAEKEKWDVTAEGIPLSVMNGPAAEVVGIRKTVKEVKEADNSISDLVAEIKKGAEESLKMAKAWEIIRSEINETYNATGLNKVSINNLSIPTLGSKQQAPGIQKSDIEETTKAIYAQEEAVGILTGAFDTLFNSTEKGFENMVNYFIAQIKRLMAELIARKIVMALFSKSNALGAVASAFSGSGIKGMASGGIAYGPTLTMVGEYSGASSNPEVIAPLNKLMQYMGGSQNVHVTVEGRLRGRDLYLVQRRG